MTSTKQIYFSTYSVRQTCCCFPSFMCTIRKHSFYSCELILLAAMAVDLALPQRFPSNCHNKCYWRACRQHCQKSSLVSVCRIYTVNGINYLHHTFHILLSRGLAFLHLSWQLTFNHKPLKLKKYFIGKKEKYNSKLVFTK